MSCVVRAAGEVGAADRTREDRVAAEDARVGHEAQPARASGRACASP